MVFTHTIFVSLVHLAYHRFPIVAVQAPPTAVADMFVSSNYAAWCAIAPVKIQTFFRIVSSCRVIAITNYIIVCIISCNTITGINNSVACIGVINLNHTFNRIGINAAQLKGKVVSIINRTIKYIIWAAVQHNQFAAFSVGVGNSTRQVNAAAASLLNIFGKDFVGIRVIPRLHTVNKLPGSFIIIRAGWTAGNKVFIRHIVAVIGSNFTRRFLIISDKLC